MTTLNSGTNWSPRLAIYGDMGSTNAQSLPILRIETDAGHFDAILHIGKPLKIFLSACHLTMLQVILPIT